MAKTIFTGPHEHLVAVLREAREAADLRQSDLADKLGRTQKFVSLYEMGQRRIDVIEFRRIAVALGVDPADLFARVMERIVRAETDQD